MTNTDGILTPEQIDAMTWKTGQDIARRAAQMRAEAEAETTAQG